MSKAIEEFVALCRLNPFEFFLAAFGVVPQPAKPENKALMMELWTCAADRFEDIVNKKLKLDNFVQFEKGRHFTWQQVCIIIAVYRALNGTLPPKIAIMTGRGIGKSRIVSMLMYLFLYVSPKPLVMATAPTADQIYGALWKEANNVHASMKQPFKGMFVWNSDHIRRTDLPNSYYARARTANTIEAMRGEHSDQQMGIADEATGVQDEIINGGWATMNTADEKVLILITNPSGNDSLVERVFEESDPDYLKLNFSGEESPIVNQEDLKKIRAKLLAKGVKPEDDRDYCIDVLGIVPKQSAMIAGYYRLFSDAQIEKAIAPLSPLDAPEYRIKPAGGVDPAGEGDDEAVGILRGFKWAKEVFRQSISSGDSVAQGTITMLDQNPSLIPFRVSVDSFGVGHDVGQKVLANSGEKKRYNITPVLVGEACESPYNERYVNRRAMLYDAMRIWFDNGGRIETNEPELWRRELRSIYAKKTTSSKLQIMSKKEGAKNGLKSPNKTDALSLTFVDDAWRIISGCYVPSPSQQAQIRQQNSGGDFNQYSMIPS
jgi:phage terminase large subunit